jgi:hypothetical protein
VYRRCPHHRPESAINTGPFLPARPTPVGYADSSIGNDMNEAFLFQVLADGVVMLHLCFILFIIFGGIIAIFWPKVLWMQIPCVMWGVFIELTGFICPLTPLENYLRQQVGRMSYRGDFIMHYLEPVIYPGGLTREFQILMGILAVVVNALVYTWILHLRRVKN